MNITTFDSETFFSKDYHLGSNAGGLTTEEYVRDKRFELLCAAVVEGKKRWWCDRDGLKGHVNLWKERQRQGEPVIMLCHHAHFDGLILNEYFDFRPDVWLDTLSMARVCFDSGMPNGLDALSHRLGFGGKTIDYDLFKGKRWAEISPQDRSRVGTDCLQDAILTQFCFGAMMGETIPKNPAVPYAFPAAELPIIDMTVRMFTEPCLKGDIDRLGAAWFAERDATNALFKELSALMGEEVTPAMLRKDDLFAEVLRWLDMEPEQKMTPAQMKKPPEERKLKYAFAKSDYFMQDLLNDEDPDVQLAAEARLKATSSIYKSRIERFGEMACRGLMCVYLGYCKAHTRRWGGGDKANWQNLPRADKYRPLKGALRKAIVAP